MITMANKPLKPSLFLAWLFILNSNVAWCLSYPNKPIRIVTSDAGGWSDIACRLLARNLSPALGQNVIVDNRNGVAGPEIVAAAAPDGYTLHLNGSSLWIAPLLRSGLSYDPIKDFAPVTLVDTSPNIVVVHPSLPVKSVKELIALASAKPGVLNYGSGSAGAPTQLAVELFKVMANVNIVHIPFKGAGPAVTALLSNQVQIMFASAGSVAAALKAGRLRALAVTTAEPSVLAPGLPTVAASGLPGYEAASVHAIFAPAATPSAIIVRLNREIGQVLRRDEIKERFLNAGVEPASNSPEQLGNMVKLEMVRLGKVIKDAGIRDE